MTSPAWLRLGGRWRAQFRFPLLAKELTETAARRRTYIMRVVYAVLLYAIFALNVPDEVWRGADQWYAGMGRGGRMFETLFIIQLAGIAIFLPALMCGRITQEKERDSLVLLFLTDLGPWEILLQKFMGGLVTMLSFFLLSLPLAGVAYAFGGLEVTEMWVMLASLLLVGLQIGALALLCSAWCRSTVGAFLLTYLGMVLMYFGPPMLGELAAQIWPKHINQYEISEYTFLLFSPAALSRAKSSSAPAWALAIAPSLVSILVMLLFARRHLVRRAFLPPSNFVRRLFGRMDTVMKRMNRATGDVVLWHGSSELPTDAPVYWREIHRRVLGKPNYLIRVLYALEIPTVLLCLLVTFASIGSDEQCYGFSVLLALLSVLATLTVSAQAANSIVSERVEQTLEVLLTTPLSAREIIGQKERALRRFLLVIAVPLLTVITSEAVMENGRRSVNTVTYLVCAVSLIVIYLPLIMWLSLWISLRVRTRFQAIITPLGVIALWVALCPVLLIVLDWFARNAYRTGWFSLVLLSPVSIGGLNEIGAMQRVFAPAQNPWIIIVANAAFYGTIALLIRWRLFASAEKLLRR